MKCKICGSSGSYIYSYKHIVSQRSIQYCRYCIHMRKNKYRISRQNIGNIQYRKLSAMPFVFEIPFSLSTAQRQAVFKLKAQNRNKTHLLLHAICGAGKTEIVAMYVAAAIKAGKVIGWSIARRDVVIELKERLQEYFPKTTVIALYQGSEDIGKVGQITVFTTARLFCYTHFFDILIIDENDAYPFNVSEQQQYATKQAITEHGVLVHVSATISKKEKKNYDAVISLARRFHGYDLPEITFEYLNFSSMKKTRIIPRKITLFIQEMLGKKYPIFFFVSSKRNGAIMSSILKKKYGEQQVVNISSAIENRTPILRAVREGEHLLIVTTTILERGVTFKNVQVVVVDSDAELFDAQTLVQIAGRVGRPFDAPTGNVILMYEHGITRAMRGAQAYHRASNRGEVLFL